MLIANLFSDKKPLLLDKILKFLFFSQPGIQANFAVKIN